MPSKTDVKTFLQQGAAVGGASGFASGLPRKRSKDPEIIKAKELARNRYTQLRQISIVPHFNITREPDQNLVLQVSLL